MAYGYHGDEKRIGANQPIICTVTLNDFKPEDSKPKEKVKKESASTLDWDIWQGVVQPHDYQKDF